MTKLAWRLDIFAVICNGNLPFKGVLTNSKKILNKEASGKTNGKFSEWFQMVVFQTPPSDGVRLIRM